MPRPRPAAARRTRRHRHEWIHTVASGIVCRICRTPYPEPGPAEIVDVHFADCPPDCPGHPQAQMA